MGIKLCPWQSWVAVAFLLAFAWHAVLKDRPQRAHQDRYQEEEETGGIGRKDETGRNRFLQEGGIRRKGDRIQALSRQQAIDEHWDEVQEYVSGTDEIEARTDTGCYSLEAEIIGGHIGTIYFSNGGSLSLFSPVDHSGNAEDTDHRGRLWVFTLDMNSLVVENAVDEWAAIKGYALSP